MSPSKFHLNYPQSNIINGVRPSPLKISKQSHLIHKSSSSSSSTSNSSSSTSAVQQKQLQRKNQPVIIYTHSPKVIHTQAKDFMALVQKLTGFSRSTNNNNQETAPPQQFLNRQGAAVNKCALKLAKADSNERKHVGHDDKESSSISKEENCNGAAAAAAAADIVISPLLKPPNAPCFADIPLFTPTTSDFFCSSRPLFRCPDSVFASPKMGNPISPSVFEFMKGLPEY